ncbi:MAG: diacylglycerol kinase family lipid kinase [Deltaproteobacteria bacterium]|nr:diacylglycerol kinase family lipid kinase [Deltaproteobacteria bacterium]MBW2445415.1 diacylglycerol kinase family lipid kinase [Deltaproteobacteria bacterium]
MGVHTVVVVNPKSRNGATGRGWQRVERALRDALGPAEVAMTCGPRDAERLAREAVAAGAERILVAGGDGTASEVVAGLLGAGLGDRAALGFLPLGTGGDWSRTLGTPRALPEALRSLSDGHERRLDAGRLEFESPDGETHETHFLNIASGGLSGAVDRLVNETPKTLGGTASFLIGTLRGLASYRNVACRVEVDGRLLHEGPLVLATAANGRYFGGGMHVAPQARPDDGLLDVVVIPGVSKGRLLSRMPDLYRGTHLELPEVAFAQGRRVEFTPEEPWHLDVDGEHVPARAARFEIVPGALRVLAPEAA